MRQAWMAAAALAAAAGGAARAQSPDTMVNQPGVTWTFYGALATEKAIKDADVKGGHAIRVTVAAKGATPYDAGAQTPIDKPVKKGDRLVFAFYIKSPSASDDHKNTLQAYIHLTKEPYTADVTGNVEVGSSWQLVHVAGVANEDHPGGSIIAAIPISGDKQVLDLGPAYVLDLGQ